VVQVLAKNDKYTGKYVAMKDFDKHTIVSSGSTPTEAYNKALKKGYNNPVITYVPEKGMVQIY